MAVQIRTRARCHVTFGALEMSGSSTGTSTGTSTSTSTGTSNGTSSAVRRMTDRTDDLLGQLSSDALHRLVQLDVGAPNVAVTFTLVIEQDEEVVERLAARRADVTLGPGPFTAQFRTFDLVRLTAGLGVGYRPQLERADQIALALVAAVLTRSRFVFQQVQATEESLLQRNIQTKQLLDVVGRLSPRPPVTGHFRQGRIRHRSLIRQHFSLSVTIQCSHSLRIGVAIESKSSALRQPSADGFHCASSFIIFLTNFNSIEKNGAIEKTRNYKHGHKLGQQARALKECKAPSTN